MQFVISHEGETLSKLVQRLYCQASDAERKRIAALVRQANPELKAAGDIPTGTVVTIPRIEGIEPSADARTERQIVAALIRNAREKIGDIGPILEQLVDQQQSAASATLNLTMSREVKKLAGEQAFVRERLVDVTEDVRERLKRSKTLRSVITTAKNELESDLNELLEQLDPTSAPPPKSKTRKRQRK